MTPGEVGEPIRVTHYCTPGLTLQATAPDNGCRYLYTASNGDLYACYGQHVLHYSSDGLWRDLGTFQPSAISDAVARVNPVTMADNGFVLLIADGSVDGWFVDLTQPVASQSITRIDRDINTGWLGADNLSFQDTFFLANAPGTTKWYCSLSNVVASNFSAASTVYTATIVATGGAYSAGDVLTLTATGGAQITVNTVDAAGRITAYGVTNGGAVNAQPTNPVAVTGGTGNGATFALTYQTNTGAFDPLDFVGMTTQVTNCVAVISVHHVVWVIGSTAYEIWTNQGGDGTSFGSFPFILYPTGFGDWGCAAKYSTATELNRVFWVSQDKHGHGMVMMGEGLAATRISTHAIEFAIAQYSTIDDAIGYTYQQQGHLFYVVTFPSAHDDRGATWAYDATSKEWHERCFIDDNGIEYRHLSNSAAGAYEKVFAGDWRNGNLYTFDLDNYTDNGSAIKRLRSFPHQIDLEANRRVMYHQLIAQMQVGSKTGSEQTSTFLDCLFEAPDNTLLQNYHNINSFGANFARIDPVNAVIINDALIGQTPGDVLYQVAGTPDTPDYTIRYKVKPTDYTLVAPAGTIISLIGRATPAYLGYVASIYSDGAQYYASLEIGNGSPMWLALGVISTGDYELYLSMQSTAINLRVYRSQDANWLTSAGRWVGSATTAIALVDTTYSAPGLILIGGNWGGAPRSISIDPVTAAIAGIGTVVVSVSADIILNLNGLQINSGLGSLGDNLSQDITIDGVETDSGLGALTIIEANFITIGISGVTSTIELGTIDVSAPQSVALVGVASVTTVGTLGADNEVDITIGISGIPATIELGTIIAVDPVFLTLTGVASATTVGTPGVQKNNTVSIGLSGIPSTAVVGTMSKSVQKSISVTGIASTTAVGSITVSGVQFAISGTHITAGLGTPTVTKVQNRSPLLSSVQAATQINGLTATTAVPATAPPQAVAAGFTHLVFTDDFTSAATVTNSTTPTSGFNWYPGIGGQTSPTNYQVLTATHANGISNGNSGGGSNASPNGGLFRINGINTMTYNGNFQNVPLATGDVGPLIWQHAYFEAYIQFNASQSSPTGWPSFWSWPSGDVGVEIDFVEAGFVNIPPSSGSAWTIHDPAGSTVRASGVIQAHADSNWHTYGCLWQGNGTTGTLDFYLDNVHIGGPIRTGSGHTVPNMETCSLYTVLGTGVGIPMYVDWVRVWQ